MTDIQNDLMKKLLGVLFMDWEEDWRKGDCGSMSAMPPHTITNGNPLSCTRHEGCPCDGDNKLRSMFSTDELEELFKLNEKFKNETSCCKSKASCGSKKQMSGFVPNLKKDS
jgi:hypothetical protein